MAGAVAEAVDRRGCNPLVIFGNKVLVADGSAESGESVTGAGFSSSLAAGFEIHRTQLPAPGGLCQPVLKAPLLFFVAHGKPVFRSVRKPIRRATQRGNTSFGPAAQFRRWPAGGP